MMASLSRTRLVEILWTLLLLAQNLGVCSGASGGYYARLLNIPLVCPYISFCMPWVPKTGLSATSHSDQIHLIHNSKLSLSLSDFFHSRSRGRLESTHACFKHTLPQRVKAKLQRNLWPRNRGVADGSKRRKRSFIGGSRLDSRRRQTKDESWCFIYADSLAVHCPEEGEGVGERMPAFRPGRSSRHVYVVPRSCVALRSSHTTQRIYVRGVNVSINSDQIQVNFDVGKIQVLSEGDIVFQAGWSKKKKEKAKMTSQQMKEKKVEEGKTTVIEEDWKDEEDDDLIDFKLDLEGDEEQEQGNWTARNGDNFGERDNRKKHWFQPQLILSSSSSQPHSKIFHISGLMTFSVHKKMAAYNQWHLELTLNYINPIWRNDSIVNHDGHSSWLKVPKDLMEEGVLWQTGLLKVIEGVMSGRGLAIDSTPKCRGHFHRESENLDGSCRCKYFGTGKSSPGPSNFSIYSELQGREVVVHQSKWEEHKNWLIGDPDERSRWSVFPDELRLQGCCDWLLGKMQKIDGSGHPMPGDGEYIYFNDRLACPKGSTLKGSSRRPRCSANFCCSKTQVEALQWNYEVRGKCWVLRPFWQADSQGNYSPEGATERPSVTHATSTKTRVSVSAAYGIIGMTTLFVVTFRIVTRKLDEWKRTVRRF